MAIANAIFIHRLADAEALTRFTQIIGTVFKDQQVTVTFTFSLQVLNSTFKCQANTVQDRPAFAVANSVIAQEQISLWGITAQSVSDSKQIAYHSSDAWRTYVSISPQHFSPQEAQLFAAAVATAFTIVREPQLNADDIPSLKVDALKLQEAALAALSAETSKLAKHSLEHLSKQEEFLHKATTELQAQFNEQQKKLEEAYRKREDELAARRQQLEEEFANRRQQAEKELRGERKGFDEEKREHEQRVHEWNLRENTAERRRLLTDMREAIAKQTSFTLSEDTNRKRGTVVWACVTVATFSFASALAFGYKVFSASTPDWHHLAPFSAATLTLLSTFIYFVRWNDQWAKEHARAEIRIKRFSEDILRASWIAELFFETKDKNIQVPDTLFTNFSQGLFGDEPLAETQHPVDQVADLVKKLSAIEVGNVKLTKAPEK